MSDHDRIVILLTRRVAGELTPTEAEELQLALEQDPMLQALASAIEGVSDAPPKGMTAKEERQMLEKGLRQWKLPAAEPPQTIPIKRPQKTITSWAAAAAAILLVILGAYLSKTNRSRPTTPIAWHEMAAKNGTRNYLELPDGSKMWLNAGSKMRYAQGKRELTLSGEAYFDIKHDPENPFLIHAGNVTVKVLGTSLNIKAYPGDSSIETTLIQGKAEIEVPGNNNPPITLHPSEKVTVYAAAQITEPQKPPTTYQRNIVKADPTYNTIIETSWVEDKLIFRKESFREVVPKLERWYNIRIHFNNDKYLDDTLTGYFKDQPIKNVMDALQLSLGFHYELAGDSILIR